MQFKLPDGECRHGATAPPDLPPHEANPMSGTKSATGPNLKNAIDQLHAAMIDAETGRTRQRSVSVAQKEKAVLSVLLANLYIEARCRSWRWLSVCVGTRTGPLDSTRYRTPLANRRQLKAVIEFLHRYGHVEYAKGYRKLDKRTGGVAYEAISSKVRATAGLLDYLERFCGVTPADVGEGEGEAIILRDSKEGKPWRARSTRGGFEWRRDAGDMMEYAETEETQRMRAEMERINAAVAGWSVTFEVGAGDSTYDHSSTRGYRVFNNGSFAEGGRLCGWWFQNVRKCDRHRLRLCREPVVEVDFQAMHLRMLYHLRGGAFPQHLDPFGPDWLGVPDTSRADVKRVFLTAVNRSGSRARQSPSEARVERALLDRHPCLGDAFASGAGTRLMRLESDVAVAVMLRLIELGIPALPLHDGFLTRERDGRSVARVMSEAYSSVVGEDALPAVSIKSCLALAA